MEREYVFSADGKNFTHSTDAEVPGECWDAENFDDAIVKDSAVDQSRHSAGGAKFPADLLDGRIDVGKLQLKFFLLVGIGA